MGGDNKNDISRDKPRKLDISFLVIGLLFLIVALIVFNGFSLQQSDYSNKMAYLVITSLLVGFATTFLISSISDPDIMLGLRNNNDDRAEFRAFARGAIATCTFFTLLIFLLFFATIPNTTLGEIKAGVNTVKSEVSSIKQETITAGKNADKAAEYSLESTRHSKSTNNHISKIWTFVNEREKVLDGLIGLEEVNTFFDGIRACTRIESESELSENKNVSWYFVKKLSNGKKTLAKLSGKENSDVKFFNHKDLDSRSKNIRTAYLIRDCYVENIKSENMHKFALRFEQRKYNSVAPIFRLEYRFNDETKEIHTIITPEDDLFRGIVIRNEYLADHLSSKLLKDKNFWEVNFEKQFQDDDIIKDTLRTILSVENKVERQAELLCQILDEMDGKCDTQKVTEPTRDEKLQNNLENAKQLDSDDSEKS